MSSSAPGSRLKIYVQPGDDVWEWIEWDASIPDGESDITIDTGSVIDVNRIGLWLYLLGYPGEPQPDEGRVFLKTIRVSE